MKKQIILVFLLTFYLAALLFTSFSLVGFWTDIFVSIILAIYVSRLVFKNNSSSKFIKAILSVVTICCSIIIFGIIFINFIHPFASDTFKLRSFYYQSVNRRLFNAYFKPVGAYAGGEGNFWITETPKYFPIVEKEVYYNRTVLWDFNSDSFERKKVDNYQVVKEFIKDEVIDKKTK